MILKDLWFTNKNRKEIILELTKVFGYKCWYCGYEFRNNGEIEVDHIKPKSKGGSNSITNLGLSCVMCNSHKFDYDAVVFLKYLARMRTGDFECSILKYFANELEAVERDILSKSFWKS